MGTKLDKMKKAIADAKAAPKSQPSKETLAEYTAKEEVVPPPEKAKGAVKPQRPDKVEGKPAVDQVLGRYPDGSLLMAVYDAGVWQLNLYVAVNGKHGDRVIGVEAKGIHFALKQLWAKYQSQEPKKEGR